MPPTDRLKLINGWNGRREALNPRGPVRLYVAANGIPQPQQALEWRIYCVAELLRQVLGRDGQPVQNVTSPVMADVVVAGTDFPSAGRALLLSVVKPTGEVPAALDLGEARYLMQTVPHSVTFQWSAGAVAGAQAALSRLKDYLTRLAGATPVAAIAEERLAGWRTRFYEPLYDDLNTPRALATLWTMLQSDLPDNAKYRLLVEFCTVAGLSETLDLPKNIVAVKPVPAPPQPPISPERPNRKVNKNPVSGLEGGGSKGNPKSGQPPAVATPPEERRRILQSRDVRSFLNEPPRFDFTVSLVAYDNLAQVRDTVESLLEYLPRSSHSIEVVAVDMNASEAVSDYLETRAAQIAHFRVVYARQNLGEAAGRNVAFRQSRGRYLVLLDAGVRLTRDIFAQLWPVLNSQTGPALYGAYGLTSQRTGAEITSFEPQTIDSTEKLVPVEALAGAILILPRAAVDPVGFMDEHFRFPDGLDLDYSFAFRDKGFGVLAVPSLAKSLERPTSRPTQGLSPEQQARQRQKNWQLFLRSWQLE